MEKVKLTPEQAESLEYLKRNFRFKEIVKMHVQKSGCEWEGSKVEPINGMDLDVLIKALYIGYEIEETYKIGDWLHVFTPNFDFVAKVVGERDEYTEFDNGKRLSSFEFIKATPEEIAAEKKRRKWAAIGREVDDYRKGDIVMVIEKIYAEPFVEGSVKVSTHPDVVEFVDPQHGPYLRRLRRCVDVNEIELVCQVEQRFDLEDDAE